MRDRLETYHNEALKHYATGASDRFIELQLAEERDITSEDIREVMQRIKVLRRSDKRSAGVRKMIFGFSIALAAGLLTHYSFLWNFEYAFIITGPVIAGVLYGMKGMGEYFNLI